MDFNPSHSSTGGGPTIHQYTFDLETQGRRSASYTELAGKKVGEGRGFNEPLGISSVTYGPMGKNATINAYTDIIDADLLRRYGVTKELLDDPNYQLPEPLLKEIVREPGRHYGIDEKPRWDPGIESNNVLRGVFRRHAKQALSGEISSERSILKGMLDEWSGIRATNGIVELAAWNISFDAPVLFARMRNLGLGSELDDLLKTNSIRVRELSDAIHEARFKKMLKDKNWVPQMTDHSVFRVALEQGLTEINAEQAKKLGAFMPFTGLREFMNDVMEGTDAFKARKANWLKSKVAGSAHSQAVVDDVIARLSNIKDWTSAKDFFAWGQRNANRAAYGETTIFQMLQEWYSTPNNKGANILGDAALLTAENERLGLFGQIHGFGFSGGYQLSEVAHLLSEHGEQLQVSGENVKLLRQITDRAHEGVIDRQVADVSAQELDRILRDEALTERFNEIASARHETSLLSRMNQLFSDLLKGRKPHSKNPLEKAVKQTVGKFDATPWLGAMTFVLGSYLLGNHLSSQVEELPKIEGLRSPETEWDTIEGVNPSDLPFSNISAFGTGYDHFTGNQIGPERVRISKVLDGDTVVFYRGQNKVTARLAGINAAEISHRGRRAEYKANQAAQFLDQMVKGNEVWIRPQVGDPVDSYGRELVFLDYQGVNVNSEIVRRGFSRANTAFPEPYTAGPEIFGFLKHRMGVKIDQTIDYLMNLYHGNARPRDPFIWTALGTVGTLTSEDEAEFSNDAAIGYNAILADHWKSTGHAGYVQHLSNDMMGSKIRDHATQLRRIPATPRTRRGRRSYANTSHAERAGI